MARPGGASAALPALWEGVWGGEAEMEDCWRREEEVEGGHQVQKKEEFEELPFPMGVEEEEVVLT